MSKLALFCIATSLHVSVRTERTNVINSILGKREARERLIERVKKAHIAKHASQFQKDCDHDFETFKETIRPDTNFAGTAYFTVKGCIKCHFKMRINYTVI